MTLDEQQARNILNLAPEAGMPELFAAYERKLQQARDAIGGDEAASVAELDMARAAFIHLRTVFARASAKETPPEKSAAPPEAPAALEHSVKFASFLAQDNRFTGKGRLKLDGGLLIITARRRRLFSFARHSESFTVSEIRNVSRSGKQVRFAVGDARRPWHAVLVCPDEAAAQALVQRLPRETDTALFGAQDIHKDLERRLDNVSGPTWAAWLLIALNVLIYLVVGNSGAGWMTTSPEKLIGFGGNFSPYTTEGEWWRLLTCTFLHGGLVHIAFNMFALYSFGRLAERLYGPLLFTGIYLVTGLAGSAASLTMNPTVVSVGASGAIFGVMGLLIAFVARDREFLPERSRKQLFINWAIFAAYAFSQGLGKAGIDNAAHFGGLISGLLIGFVIGTPARLNPQSVADTGRRALAGIAVALIATGAAAASAPRLGPDLKAHQALTEVLQSIGRQEQKMADEGKRLAAAQKSGSLTRIEGIASISQLQTDYQQIEGRLQAIRPRPETLKTRQLLLQKFLSLRLEGLALLVESEKRQDESLAQAGKEKLEAGNKLVAEMVKPVQWFN